MDTNSVIDNTELFYVLLMNVSVVWSNAELFKSLHCGPLATDSTEIG